MITIDKKWIFFKSIVEILKQNSFQEAEDNKLFMLRSGKTSKFFIDCKKSSLTSKGQSLFAAAIYNIIESLRLHHKVPIDTVAGVALGGCPLATAVAFYSHQYSSINSLFVTKDKEIEGYTENVKNIALLEDVVTTGGSSVKAISALEKAGFNVPVVICLVDRLDGGKQYIETQTKSKLISICTLNDLRDDIIKISSDQSG